MKYFVIFSLLLIFIFNFTTNNIWAESKEVAVSEGPPPLPDYIKENPMPLEIRKSMWNSCSSLGDGFSKEEQDFWQTLHVKLLSITPEFKSLNGKLSSITIHSSITATSCPPHTGLNGTFTSANGDEHRYNLGYNVDIFRYQIDNLFPTQYQGFIAPPLKQFKAGFPNDTIECKENLVLIIKASNGNPACVKPETKEKLIQRGWTVNDQKPSKSGTFYAQPVLTSVKLKKGDTVRVHLFSYAITAYSDNKWVEVYDERPKNTRIGIVEKSIDNAKTFASSDHEILPNGITAKKLFEEGYFVVYLTADSSTKAGKYELSIVSIDENSAVIEKPLYLTITEQPSIKSPQEEIFRVIGSGYKFGIELDNISEQEYWKREDNRKPWPPLPILNITDSNIHPAVKKLIDAMWDSSGKFSPFEYDKNILVKDTRIIFSGSENMEISDWLKKIHDQQFERNLDDSSSHYIRYHDKIYFFGGWIGD
jgi:hypothetical protein